MKTKYIVLYPDGEKEELWCNLPKEPTYSQLAEVIGPHFPGAWPEHVSVLYHNKRADMFVDENGHSKHLARNEAATAIYRAASMLANPNENPEDIPYIVGPAIIFDRIVWN